MTTVPIDLDIDMLRCFVEVAESGSFTKAGKVIGLTQSGVSVKIRRLEERLDALVFDRSGKILLLTPEGETLLEYARRILSVHDEAVGRLTRPAATGTLRIGLVDYFLPELLPALLGRFRKRYPRINLEIKTELGMDLLPGFRRGELDLAVVGRDDFDGPARVLFEEPLVWAVGQAAEIPVHDRIQIAALPAPCYFRKLALDLLESDGRSGEVVFTGSSIPSVQAAVQAGIGISVLPRGALRKGLRRAPAALNLPDLPRFALALVLDESRDDPARDEFVGYLEAELEEL